MLDPKKGIFLETVGSTSVYIKNPMIEAGQWVLSDKQTSGKGRGENKWIDLGEEKIIFSGKVNFHKKTFPSSLLSLFCGSAVLRAIHSVNPEYEKAVKLKWPNDIFKSDKKIAGILIEGEERGDEFVAYIGIGLNIYGDNVPENLEKAGFLTASKPEKDFRMKLMYQIIDQLNRNLLLLIDGSGIKTETDWIDNNSFLSRKMISTMYNGSIISGEVIGFTEKGFLIVESPSGERFEIFDTSPELLT
ncbi:MAG: biotin--[acetyl-CoA-carboxylase] ligase [Leptospira sp.]|nr:biotin--[acetyl-CoA-carboxylase] ligase [Leptospira sp.]